MISIAAFRLLCIIFFGSVTLIGRAQNDFFQFDTNFPSRTLFPFVDGTVFNIKDLVDDVRFLFLRVTFAFLPSCARCWTYCFHVIQLQLTNVHV